MTDAAPPADRAPAASADAAPSADGAGPGMLAAVESLQVPASGDAVTFKTSLDQGQLFLLKATGAVEIGGQHIDAEYGGFDPSGAGAGDMMGTVDVGIDVGLKQIHAAKGRTEVAPGPGRMKWFGGFSGEHAYYMTVTGAGAPLSLKLAKPATGTGTGGLTVALLRLSPTPDGIGEPLDTTMVPLVKTKVMTKVTTEKDCIYLLQAAGAGTCGGANLKMGDAEFMDWKADGAGKNEGEGGVDFGIGVDEPDVGKGVGHDPRLRWWGPWRLDHHVLHAVHGHRQSDYARVPRHRLRR